MKRNLIQSGICIICACILCLLTFSCTVAAYELVITTPTSLAQGTPLVVTGTTNLPPGIPIDVALYREEDAAEEVARQTVTLQGTPEFSVVFDTGTLPVGLYKVQVPGFAGFPFLGNSISIQHVTILSPSWSSSVPPTTYVTPTGTPADEIIIGTVLPTRPIVGDLAVNTTPASALAVLDGKYFNSTPCIFRDVERGYHSLSVSSPGYESSNTTVFVSGGETTRVFVSLRPSPTPTATPTLASLPDMGTVSISSEPSDAEVSIDLVFRGFTPLILVSIEQGPHTIVITKEGYEVWQTEITVQDAGNISVNASLVPVVMTATTRASVGGWVAVLGVMLGVVVVWRRREG